MTATSSRPELVPSENIAVASEGARRTVNVTPAANVSGTLTITLKARDAAGRETLESFTLTIAPVNDDPAAEDDGKTTAEDEALTFPADDLLCNDSPGPNESGQALAVVSVGGAQNGTVSLRDGRITFTPDENYNGLAGFTYTVEDEGGARHGPSTWPSPR